MKKVYVVKDKVMERYVATYPLEKLAESILDKEKIIEENKQRLGELHEELFYLKRELKKRGTHNVESRDMS